MQKPEQFVTNNYTIFTSYYTSSNLHNGKLISNYYMLLTIKSGKITTKESDFNYANNDLKFWFKGYFFIEDDYYSGDNACKYIEKYLFAQDINSPENLNGIYQCVIINEEKRKIYIINDRFGFHQLFYFSSNDILFLSDNFWEVVKEAKITDIDETSLLEFLQYRFVSGKYTLAKDIFCIEPSSIYSINYSAHNFQIEREIYWHFSYTPTIDSKSIAEEKIYYNLNKIISRYKKSIFENKNIGINLTGGLDSRFILGLLIRNEIPKEKIFSYTFGSSTCEDIKIAKNISSFLNINHHEEIFDDYFTDFFDKDSIDNILYDLGFYTYYFQGYGFKKLNKNNTGIDFLLSGFDGFFVSLYASREIFEATDYHQIADIIYNVNATMLSETDSNIISRQNFQSIKQKLIDRIINEQIDKAQDPVSIYYNWTLKNRNRKYLLANYEIQNKNAVHLLQYYDYEFVDLMSNMSPSMIINQVPYTNSMYKNVFSEDLFNLRTIPIEKRGVFYQSGDDFLEKKKPRITPKKIVSKLVNLPDRVFQYPIQKTLRNTQGIFDTIIQELISTDSKYLNNAECVNLIQKMKRSDKFTRYGLIIIISILRFEEMLKNDQSSDR